MTTHPWSEIRDMPYKYWYQFGLRSPSILWKRSRVSKWPFRLRMAWQRARHEFADDQAWSLNYAHARLVVFSVRKMREWANGYPTEFSPEFGGGGWETWDEILARIEEGFQAWLDADGWFSDAMAEEEAKFNDAMALYAKWFGALWD